MTAIELSWHGQAEQDAIFAKLVESSFPAMAAALHEAQAPAFTQSQVLVPVLTGLLKSTGKHPTPEIQGTVITDIISYGDYRTKENARPPAASATSRRTRALRTLQEDVGYEVYVHEGHGRGRKFLETPVMENQAGLDQRLGAAFKAALEGAVG